MNSYLGHQVGKHRLGGTKGTKGSGGKMGHHDGVSSSKADQNKLFPNKRPRREIDSMLEEIKIKTGQTDQFEKVEIEVPSLEAQRLFIDIVSTYACRIGYSLEHAIKEDIKAGKLKLSQGVTDEFLRKPTSKDGMF